MKQILILLLFLFSFTNLFAYNKYKICKKNNVNNVVKGLNYRYNITNLINKQLVKKAMKKNNKLLIQYIFTYKNIKKLNKKNTQKNLKKFCLKLNNTLEFKCISIYNKIPVERKLVIKYNNNKNKLIFLFDNNCNLK